MLFSKVAKLRKSGIRVIKKAIYIHRGNVNGLKVARKRKKKWSQNRGQKVIKKAVHLPIFFKVNALKFEIKKMGITSHIYIILKFKVCGKNEKFKKYWVKFKKKRFLLFIWKKKLKILFLLKKRKVLFGLRYRSFTGSVMVWCLTSYDQTLSNPTAALQFFPFFLLKKNI